MKLRAPCQGHSAIETAKISKQLTNKYDLMKNGKKTQEKRKIDESDEMNRNAISLEMLWIQKSKFFKFLEKTSGLHRWPKFQGNINGKKLFFAIFFCLINSN